MPLRSRVARPMLSSLGPRRSFERGSLIAAVAYTLLSQACRPVGAPGMRLAVQYVLAKCLLMTPYERTFIPDLMRVAAR